jgi:hypothetical protein
MMHHAVVEGVTVPAGLHVPSMMSVRCESDLRQLEPAGPELAAFAKKVSQMNMLLADAALARSRLRQLPLSS